MDEQKVQVWNVNTTDKGMVRVATIDGRRRKPSMCEGCSAPCCRGIFRPILTSKEFLTKKYPIMLIDVPEWLKKKVPRAQKVAVLAFTNNTHCNYFDPVSCKCTIFPDCPEGCLAYDCREDTRPEIRGFVEQRKREWQQQ